MDGFADGIPSDRTLDDKRANPRQSTCVQKYICLIRYARALMPDFIYSVFTAHIVGN
jgi:hypothetical protein